MIASLDSVAWFPPGGKKILSDISWNIEEQSRWVLFGRNGSGKTKLLEIVSGYRFPSEGTVSRFDNEFSDIREARRFFGFIGSYLKERIPLKDTVLDVVMSGIHATIGVYHSDDTLQARALSVLNETDMSGTGDRVFSTLSDGEKQKVLMARALVNSPRCLILDEPASALDLVAREDLLATLEKVSSRRKMALIYVTHHTDEILPFFENMYVVKEGLLWYEGPVESMMNEKSLSEFYGYPVTVLKRGNRYFTIPASSQKE